MYTTLKQKVRSYGQFASLFQAATNWIEKIKLQLSEDAYLNSGADPERNTTTVGLQRMGKR
jgi:hypothetical protein